MKDQRGSYETGLAAGILVAGGQVDCIAGWIGGGAVNEGDIQMNLANSGILVLSIKILIF